jgi:hypothetical protein
MDSTGLWDIKDTSMQSSKMYQMKVSQETGSETNIVFGRASMPYYIGVHPPKAAVISF